jgi:murein DD-endopeptidase MepM/ murein hydrolase activator NlpD
MRKNKFLLWISIPVICVSGLSGCASAPIVKPAPIIAQPPAGLFYHRVEKGQTLWQISRMYGADLDELIRTNHIADVSNVETGQLILVPRRQQITRPVAPIQPDSEGFIWPVKGRVVAYFGSVSDNMTNRGINIQPNAPSAIVASRGGRVVFSAPDFSAYGKTVIIDHGDGFLSVYAKGGEMFVKAGDIVQKGAVIGRTGSRGSEYLHFEIRKGYTPQNPKFYLP